MELVSPHKRVIGLKRGEHYRDSATYYAARPVQGNAARWIKALTRYGFIPAAFGFDLRGETRMAFESGQECTRSPKKSLLSR
ncbi:MAG: hypothetical protein V4857_09085 [Pseudomonadota bacterium]